jgi:hydrogenase nickel incorporation protein HypA/HybF
MHELSITQSLFDLVLDQANKAGVKKVSVINLVIGDMTGIVGDSVRFYLDFIARETIIEGAKLNIKTVATRAMCRDCRKESGLREFDWTCPECGGSNLELISGKELFVESIEVD